MVCFYERKSNDYVLNSDDGQFFLPVAYLLLVFSMLQYFQSTLLCLKYCRKVITSACQLVQRFAADINPANLIKNIIPSPAIPSVHDKQPGGECESININGSIQ